MLFSCPSALLVYVMLLLSLFLSLFGFWLVLGSSSKYMAMRFTLTVFFCLFLDLPGSCPLVASLPKAGRGRWSWHCLVIFFLDWCLSDTEVYFPGWFSGFQCLIHPKRLGWGLNLPLDVSSRMVVRKIGLLSSSIVLSLFFRIFSSIFILAFHASWCWSLCFFNLCSVVMVLFFLDLLRVILGVLARGDSGLLTTCVDGGLSFWLLAVSLVGDSFFFWGVILLPSGVVFLIPFFLSWKMRRLGFLPGWLFIFCHGTRPAHLGIFFWT